MDCKNSIESTEFPWQQNSYIKVEQSGRTAVRVLANREGLLSLAAHLEALANNGASSILYEDSPGDLEAGSLSLEIQMVYCTGKTNYAYAFESKQEHSFEMAPVQGHISGQDLKSETRNPYLYTAEPEKRYTHFLHSFQKNRVLWVLGNEAGALTITTGDEKALLIWPEAVYAADYAEQAQMNLKPVCLTWDEAMEFVKCCLSDPKAGFFVFAAKQNGYLVSADKFLMDLGVV